MTSNKPTDLEQAMSAAGGGPNIRRLARQVSEMRSTTCDNPPKPGYAGMRPAVDAAIAVYLNAAFADFAVDDAGGDMPCSLRTDARWPVLSMRLVAPRQSGRVAQ